MPCLCLCMAECSTVCCVSKSISRRIHPRQPCRLHVAYACISSNWWSCLHSKEVPQPTSLCSQCSTKHLSMLNITLFRLCPAELDAAVHGLPGQPGPGSHGPAQQHALAGSSSGGHAGGLSSRQVRPPRLLLSHYCNLRTTVRGVQCACHV